MPIGSRNEGVEQVSFDCRPIGERRAAQLPRVTQFPGQFAGAGVVDGTGQADHQRRSQRLSGWFLSTEGTQDRVPAGRRTWTTSVITQVTRDGVGVQRAQLDCRCCPQGHLDTARRSKGVPVLPGAARHYEPFAGAQRVVDPADRWPADCVGDLVQAVEDRQDHASR